MWGSYHKTTTHGDANCHVRPASRLNGNAHFIQVRPPSVPGICSSWDLPVRDASDEKPCISLLAREVQPAAKPANARVEKEKGARPFGPVPTVATEGWRTRPWSFTPRAEPAISFRGPVAEENSNTCYTFGMANDEEPVEKALMALLLVAVTSEDSVTAERQASTSTTPSSETPNTICRTTCVLQHPARFSLPGELAGRYSGRRAARPCHRRQRQPNPRSGRYRDGARDWAQSVLGNDSSQNEHCNHL